MNKCKKCGVYIADKTAVCPLCRMVLTEVDGEPEVNMYPNILQQIRIRTKILRIATFVLFLTQVLLVIFNVSFFAGVWWSGITGATFAYLLFTIYYTILQHKSAVQKLGVQSVITFLLLLVIDIVLGFRGWSLAYGVPCGILVMDGIVVLFMVFDFRHWQSYLLVQIFNLLLSIVWMGLWVGQIMGHGILIGVAFGVTLVLFCLCMLLGSQKAWSELHRRFYI